MAGVNGTGGTFTETPRRLHLRKQRGRHGRRLGRSGGDMVLWHYSNKRNYEICFISKSEQSVTALRIRHVQLFVAAAEELHFSRAAKRENIVQSALSAAIKALEEELGSTLFIRSTRRVELSPTGQIFLPEARRILESVSAAKAAVAGVHQGLSGRLAIGTIETMAPFINLPLLLQSFQYDHPNVSVVVRDVTQTTYVESLRDGSLDLVFMQVAGTLSPSTRHQTLSASPIVVTMAETHRLANRETVEFAELAEENFIDFSLRWGTRQFIDHLFAREKIVRHASYEVESYDLVAQFVSRGIGVALMPEAMARYRRLPYVRIVPRPGDPAFPPWELGIFWLNMPSSLSSNPLSDYFRRRIQQYILIPNDPV
jgi:DNA-binding transcriptional LysR family regulator